MGSCRCLSVHGGTEHRMRGSTLSGLMFTALQNCVRARQSMCICIYFFRWTQAPSEENTWLQRICYLTGSAWLHQCAADVQRCICSQFSLPQGMFRLLCTV